MDDLEAKMQSANISSSSKVPQQGKQTEEPSSETCRYWALGRACPEGSNCGRAHHFFPIISNRAHRNPIKVQTCNAWRIGECPWPPDTCDFAHKEVETNVEDGLKTAERETVAPDTVKLLVENQDWTSTLTLKCKYCNDFEIEGAEGDYKAATNMAEHCLNSDMLGIPIPKTGCTTTAPVQTVPARAAGILPSSSMSSGNAAQPNILRMGSDARGLNFPGARGPSTRRAPYIPPDQRNPAPPSGTGPSGFRTGSSTTENDQQVEKQRRASKGKMIKQNWRRDEGGSKKPPEGGEPKS